MVKNFMLDSQVAAKYLEQVVAAEFEQATISRFTKELKKMARILAKLVVSKYDITMTTQPDIKSNKQIVAIRLNDKNLYSRHYYLEEKVKSSKVKF